MKIIGWSIHVNLTVRRERKREMDLHVTFDPRLDATVDIKLSTASCFGAYNTLDFVNDGGC